MSESSHGQLRDAVTCWAVLRASNWDKFVAVETLLPPVDQDHCSHPQGTGYWQHVYFPELPYHKKLPANTKVFTEFGPLLGNLLKSVVNFLVKFKYLNFH